VPKESNKASTKIRKRKALQNKLSKVEPNQAIRKDIQQDDKMLLLIMTNTSKTQIFYSLQQRKNGVRQAIVRLGGCSRRN
jgi:NACalpha-BTF3-like transcription factor